MEFPAPNCQVSPDLKPLLKGCSEVVALLPLALASEAFDAFDAAPGKRHKHKGRGHLAFRRSLVAENAQQAEETRPRNSVEPAC